MADLGKTLPVSDAITVITDIVGQARKLPFAGLLFFVLIAIGVVLKKSALFPNKYIPLVTLSLGAVGYAFLGDPGQIDPGQPYPRVILAFYGTILGFITWGSHRWFLKRLEQFLPRGFFPKGSFDTDQFTKPLCIPKDELPKS